MKLLCLSIVAVCLVSSLEASSGPVFDNKPVIKYVFQSLNKFFSFFNEKENFMSTQHRQRQQVSPQCLKDINETQGQQLESCTEVWHKFGDYNISSNETDMYCRQHCPSYILTLAERLYIDCDIPDTLDPNVKIIINQSCDQGPTHDTCLNIWNKVVQLSNLSTVAVTYIKCLQENERNNKICNPDCKTTESWIESNIGCCYRALNHYYMADGPAYWLLRDYNWNICNMKQPDYCTEVAPIGPTSTSY